MQSMFKKYSRYIGVLATLLVFGFVFYYFSVIVTWVVLAWVISLLGSPLVAFMGKLRYKDWEIPSSIRAIVVLVLFYGIFSLLFYMFVPVIVQQGRELARVDYASLLEALEEPLDHVNDWLVERGFIAGALSGHIYHHNNVDSTQNTPSVNTLSKPTSTQQPVSIARTTTVHLDSILLASGDSLQPNNIHLNIALNIDPSVLKGINDSTTTKAPTHEEATGIALLKAKLIDYISPSQIAARSVVYLIELLGNFLILISSVTFIAFFFLKDEKLFGTAIKALLPTGRVKEMDTALSAIKRLLTRYFSGILAQITVITIYVTILLSFLGIPNAFLIAFFAGIINVIPYLGPLLGAMFGMLVIISSNIDASFYMITGPMLLKTCGVFASMQLIDGFILQPYIFSNSVSAHPLEIFIVVVIGANLGGITGMIVAIPVYTIIRVIAAVFLREFRLVQKLTQSMNYQDEDEHPVGEKVDIEVEK